MIAQLSRNPWRATWRVATSDSLLAGLLLIIAVGLAISAWLPQMPLADPAAYSLWLSETQTHFGQATSTMQALGLFTIERSPALRALLALLAGCLLPRLIESGDRLRRNRQMAEPTEGWQTLTVAHLSDAMDILHQQHYRVLSAPPVFQADRWPWAELWALMSHSGALLLLIGLLLAHLWGWHVEGLIVQSGERVVPYGTGAWISLDDNDCRATHSPGIITFVEACGPGMRVSATDNGGRPLSLQQTAWTDPVAQLTIALTEDRYFAIPEAQLGVRLAAQHGPAAGVESPVLVQVYRSPPGRLETETVVGEEAELRVGEVMLELVRVPYARVTATFNPGLWPASLGLVLLIVGVLGNIAWPARRLWLREGADRVEGAGDLSPALLRD